MFTAHKLFNFFINKPIYMRILFVVMFIIYGVIISFISYSFSNYYQTQNTKSKMIETQIQSFRIKSNDLKEKVEYFENNLISLQNSKIFKTYLKDKKSNPNVIDIFNIVMSNNKNISQLRYIDKDGNEKIRFDRMKIGLSALNIHDTRLQNKANRYYFKDIKNTQRDAIWYSKVDLNVEYGLIQRPIVPTLRIGTPIYYKGVFDGVLIMNIFVKDIINTFVESPFFYISIFDKDGEFIHNVVEYESNIRDYSWSRYLKKDYTLHKHKQYIKNVLDSKSINEYVLVRELYSIIPNADDLTVRYEPKLLKLKQLEQNANNYILTVTFIVLFISVPLAFLISVIPNILNDALEDTKKRLEEEIKVIDEYVYLSVTDKKGVILDVSNAYANMTGYTKSELLGKTHNILKHPETKSELHNEIWRTILKKKTWRGEIKNIKKSGRTFNVKLLIRPNLDSKGEIKNFTAFMQDITYQKRIEKISITDELTKLYNRREFNRIFKRYIGHAIRYRHPMAFMILDIDYFKQYNDTYGHLKGDRTLEKVSRSINENCKRVTDTAFRLGGEEFGILFSAENKEEALEFANRVRQRIEDLKIEHKSSSVNKYVTISVGFYFSEDISDVSEDHIYQACDNALYRAKELGRNQVSIAQV